MASGRPKGLRIRTEVATSDEFIALYRDNCDEAAVFVPTDKTLPEGADCAFSIELVNGMPMLRGLGVVLNAWSTEDNRFGRVGLHIGFTQLTSASEPVLDQLLEKRAIAHALHNARARQRPAQMTQRHFGLPPIDPDAAAEADEESVVRDVRRSITHELGAAPEVTAAAAPAAIVDDRSSHTVRYEGLLRGPAPPAARVAAKVEGAAAEGDATFVAPTFGMYAPDAEPSQTVPPLPPPPEEAVPPTPPPPARFAAASAPVPTVRSTGSATRLLEAWAWLRARGSALGGQFMAMPERRRIAAVFAAGILVGVLMSVALRGPGESSAASASSTSGAPARVAIAPPAECAPAPSEPAVLAKAHDAAVATDGVHVAAPTASAKPAAIAKSRAIAKPAATTKSPAIATPAAKPAVTASPAAKPAAKQLAAKSVVTKPAVTSSTAKPAAKSIATKLPTTTAAKQPAATTTSKPAVASRPTFATTAKPPAATKAAKPPAAAKAAKPPVRATAPAGRAKPPTRCASLDCI